MQEPHKHIIAIACACIAVISVVVAIKFGRVVPNTFYPEILTPRQSTPTAPESSFFETKPATTATSTPSTATKPKPPPVIPGITAYAFLAGNVATGEVYVSQNATKVLPVASMSKLVTAFVATDELSATSTITITEAEAQAPPDSSNLKAGERFTLKELLYPMLLNSSNVAAEAIASSTDRHYFLKQMSSYAWEVGMPKAYFADPSGVDPLNSASAEDVFGLAKYLYKFRPDILAITKIDHLSTATTTEHGSHEFTNIHPFVKEPGFLGGKTGHTPEAGDTMMTIMDIGGQPIAFVVLASDSGIRAADTRLMIAKIQSIFYTRQGQ